MITLINTAATQLGIQEIPIGSNWGPDIKKYLASVGIDFPASWCMAYVYWCASQYCQYANIENPLIKTGGVLRQWNEVAPALKNQTPQPGDIFIMDFGHGEGHCGFVESISELRLHTIEGNTNDTGSREGFEVCRRIRTIGSCKGFIRIPQPTPIA